MKQCIQYINESTCPFLSIQNAAKQLKNAGFQEITNEQTWNFSNGKYFLNLFDSFLVAFTLPKPLSQIESIHLALAHDDSPVFKLKSWQTMSPVDSNEIKTVSITCMLNGIIIASSKSNVRPFKLISV